MNIITLWQPWATFCVTGIKKYETRNWGKDIDNIDLAIHSAKRNMQQEEWDLVADVADHLDRCNRAKMASYIRDKRNYPRGVIMGRCRATGMVMSRRLDNGYYLYLDSVPDLETMMGLFEPGRIAWRLEDMRMLETPLEHRGQQGLRTLSMKAAQAVNEGAIRVIDGYPI